jgi:hypothetical protein
MPDRSLQPATSASAELEIERAQSASAGARRLRPRSARAGDRCGHATGNVRSPSRARSAPAAAERPVAATVARFGPALRRATRRSGGLRQ